MCFAEDSLPFPTVKGFRKSGDTANYPVHIFLSYRVHNALFWKVHFAGAGRWRSCQRFTSLETSVTGRCIVYRTTDKWIHATTKESLCQATGHFMVNHKVAQAIVVRPYPPARCTADATLYRTANGGIGKELRASPGRKLTWNSGRASNCRPCYASWTTGSDGR